METNDFLIRGAGKNNGQIRKSYFYKFYKQKTTLSAVNKTIYNKFLKELLDTLSKEIIENNLELRLVSLGKIRIRAKKLNFLRKNGELARSLKVDWKRTWEYWETKYPDLTRKEIVQIKNKKVLYHENEHSQGEFYEHHWNKYSSLVKHQNFYKFIPSRQYSRLLAKIVKDPHRKIFYYG